MLGIIIIVLAIAVLVIFCSIPNDYYSEKDLFNKFGSTYLDTLKRDSDKKDVEINNYKKRLDRLQNKVDTCVLIFEEYFEQDQTNDDLLVLAFEQLHNMSDIKTDGFCLEEDARRVLRKGLSVMKLEMQKLRKV